MHLTVISKHITAPCDLLQGQDDILNCGTRSQGLFIYFFNSEDKFCILFLTFCQWRKGSLLISRKRGESSHLVWNGWEVQYWKKGVGGCSLIKCTMTRIISCSCHWFFSMYISYLVKDPHLLQRAYWKCTKIPDFALLVLLTLSTLFLFSFSCTLCDLIEALKCILKRKTQKKCSLCES